MPNFTLQEWSAITQVVLTAITFVGIVVSIFLSVRALREVQADRRQRQRPHLAFEGGGIRLSVEFVKAGRAIPGVNPKYVASVFNDLPPDAESVRIKHRQREDGSIEPIFYGHLKNYGLGPALEARVTWIPETVMVGSETFKLDSAKLNEPRYSQQLNSMPAWRQHILPGEDSQLTRLLTFIEKDVEKKISQVEGVLEISCQDVFGLHHIRHQDFYIRTGYSEATPYVHITFLRLRERRAEGA